MGMWHEGGRVYTRTALLHVIRQAPLLHFVKRRFTHMEVVLEVLSSLGCYRTAAQPEVHSGV
jgi:hypothetical protein